MQVRGFSATAVFAWCGGYSRAWATGVNDTARRRQCTGYCGQAVGEESADQKPMMEARKGLTAAWSGHVRSGVRFVGSLACE